MEHTEQHEDAMAGAARPVHNTTLADDEGCRPKDTYEELINSGYSVGIRDYLSGPRLERFARGADEAGYTLLATADRDTLLSVVEAARCRLSLPTADEHALRMTAAMLCANPPVCTVHGALLAFVLDRWGIDVKDVMQEIIFCLQNVPAQRTPARCLVEVCLKLLPGEPLEFQLAEMLQDLCPLSVLEVGNAGTLASPGTYGPDAPLQEQSPQSADCGSSAGHHSNMFAVPALPSHPSLAQPSDGASLGAFAPQSSTPLSTYGFGAPYSPFRIPQPQSRGQPADSHGNLRSESAQLSASSTVPFSAAAAGGQHLSFTTPQQSRGVPPSQPSGMQSTPVAPRSVTLGAGCTWTGSVTTTGLQQGAAFDPGQLGERWSNPNITVMSSPVQGDAARLQVTNNGDTTLVLPLSIVQQSPPPTTPAPAADVDSVLRSLDSAIREGMRSLVATLAVSSGGAFNPVPLLLELQEVHRMPPYYDGLTLRDMVLLVRSGVTGGLTFIESVDKAGFDLVGLVEVVRRSRIVATRASGTSSVQSTAAGDTARDSRQRVQPGSSKSAARPLRLPPPSDTASNAALHPRYRPGDAGRVPAPAGTRRVGAADVGLGLDLLATCASSASLAVPGYSDDEGDDPYRAPYGLSVDRPSYPPVEELASRGRSSSLGSSRASYSRSGSRGHDSRSRSPERERHAHFVEGATLAGDAEPLVMSAYGGGSGPPSLTAGPLAGAGLAAPTLVDLKFHLRHEERVPIWYEQEPQYGVLRRTTWRASLAVLDSVAVFQRGPEASAPRFDKSHFTACLSAQEFPFQRNTLLERLLYNYYWWRLSPNLSVDAATRRVLESLQQAVVTSEVLAARSRELREVTHRHTAAEGLHDLIGLLEQELLPTDSSSVNSKFYSLRWESGSFYDYYMTLINADSDKTSREICEWYCSVLQNVRAVAQRTSENGDVHPSLIQLCQAYINTNRESTDKSDMIVLLKRDEHAKQPLSVLLQYGKRSARDRDRPREHERHRERDGGAHAAHGELLGDDESRHAAALEQAALEPPGGAPAGGGGRRKYPKRPYQIEKVIASGLIASLGKPLLAISKKKLGVDCPLCKGSPRRSTPLSREYKSQAEYRQAHDGASPYESNSKRKIRDHPEEIISHTLHRCEEVGLLIANHVAEHPEHEWMLDALSDAEMAEIFPRRS